jgi:tRNA (mo5U34)-methyltransferase
MTEKNNGLMGTYLVDEVNALSWFHTIDLGNGIVTPGLPKSSLIMRAFDEIDFTGKRVLDIGCWDGLWSFEAEKRGAAEVYATDLVSKRSSQNTGSFKHSTEPFKLAKDILQSDAKYFPEMPIEHVRELGVKFDIVLFLGVYYHLRNPLHALGILRNVLNDGGLIVVEGTAWYNWRKSFATFLYHDIAHKDRSNWWLPSVKCLEEWIESSFFRKRQTFLHTNKVLDRAGWFVYGARRVIGAVAPKLYIRSYHGRAVVVAQAVSGKDPLWPYPDPLFAGIDGNMYRRERGVPDAPG